MNKLPFSPIEKHHAWSDDPARDRAVRLAEDGVTERPTLEEAIAGVFTENHEDVASSRKTEGESMSWMRTERVTLEIEHSSDVSASKRWWWDTIVLRWAPDIRSVRVVTDAENDKLQAARDAAVMQAGELARNEEKLQRNLKAAYSEIDDIRSRLDSAHLDIATMSRHRKIDIEETSDGIRICRGDHPGLGCRWEEFVPVERVAAAERAREEMRESALAANKAANMAMEEKDKAQARVAHLEDANRALQDAADTATDQWVAAKARVADLEEENASLASAAYDAAPADPISPERIDQLVKMATGAKPAPAAEPVAWAVRWDGSSKVDCDYVYDSRAGAQCFLDFDAALKGAVVPLYTAPAAEPVAFVLTNEQESAIRYFCTLCGESDPVKIGHAADLSSLLPGSFGYTAPPPARGWLTEEERVALDAARTILDQGGRSNIGVTIDALLARNAPPRVKMPPAVHKDILAALAAAGVKVEVQS